MTNDEFILMWIVLIPLIGALLNTFIFRLFRISVVATISTLAVFIPFLLSLKLFFGPLSENKNVHSNLFEWIYVPMQPTNFHVPFALVADHLSGLFLLIITGVGALIHMYSAEYMSHEKKPYRFFVYLNLFIVSMLLLVLGSNMLVTFLGWEGVGVCSYLLIGYWFEDNANSMAAIKAFLFNRIGDMGFLIAMFLCYHFFGSLEYSDLSEKISQLSALDLTQNHLVFTIIGLCLLLGVCGKSAQIPLYTWLPDAMAGPTPVSALIHAATMVTAGIYLMARTSFLLVHSNEVMTTIAIIGASTAFISATIGFAQTDIKKVLAYSTCSQLGYMVMACGVGAFQYGVAHVMTHAFFKACLFLGAGSVIHALHHEQDIRNMGGLWKRMPVTFVTFLISTLAIIGFPGFSGFFSKDSILSAAMFGPFGHPAFWVIGTVTAALTSFYMFRLTWLVFLAPTRVKGIHHVHETNFVITIPLVILAILATVGGFISIPEVFTGHADFITNYLNPVLDPAFQYLKIVGHQTIPTSSQEFELMKISVSLSLLCAVLAILIYRNGIQGGERFAKLFGGFYRLVLDKWRVDEFYHLIIVKPLEIFSRQLYFIFDRILIEGIINGASKTLYVSTALISDAQSGNLRNYLKLIFVTLLIFGLYFLFYCQ